MKRLHLIYIFLIAVVFSAAAQTPVRWRMSVKMADDTSGTVTLRAIVEPGWHLYGTSLPESGPRPTRFDFHLTGVKLEGNLVASAPTVHHFDDMFGMVLNWWESNVSFSQAFTVEHREGAKISVTVNYMACDNKTCLPPKTQTLTYTFK